MKSRSPFPYSAIVFMQMVLVLLVSGSAGAATPTSGVIQQNTTWSGEINVVGDVVVNHNVTLTILPGTTIKFGTSAKTYDCWSFLFPGEPQPDDWGTNKWLVVMGRLVAEGTPDNFITFTSAAATPAKGDWNSIFFHNITGNSSLQYCLIEYGGDAINTSGDGNTNYTITIRNNVIRHSEEAILLAATGNADIQYNTIYDNNEGIDYHKSMEGFCKLVTLQNNIIVSNTDIGVNNSSRGCTYVSSHNDVWDNGLNYDPGLGDPVSSPIINTTDISVDPKFVQYPNDLHLQATSPCLTASVQGGRIGAYDGVPDCNGDNGGTAYIDDCQQCVGGNTGVVDCSDPARISISGDLIVDVEDVILGLEVISGKTLNSSIDVQADIDGDSRIGMAEVISSLRTPTPQVPTVESAGQIWMDRNLGASRAASSLTDSEAYGDLYQWGRLADGHEKRTSSTSSIPSSSDVPGHGSFIIGDPDWRNPSNNNLWQGVSGTNNPCPSGFRLPTKTELQTELTSWSSSDATGAFSSPLKFVLGGARSRTDGNLANAGNGQYWSSTASSSYSSRLAFGTLFGNANMGYTNRAYGFSVRCLKD